MSKATTVLLFLAAIGLMCAGVLAWLAYVNATPVVVFAGFKQEPAERVALFAVENHSSGTICFGSRVTLRRQSQPDVEVPAHWIHADPDSGVARANTPGGRSEFTVRLQTPDGSPITTPFRARLQYRQNASPAWRYPPLSWLCAALRPSSKDPSRGAVWSAEVTP